MAPRRTAGRPPARVPHGGADLSAPRFPLKSVRFRSDERCIVSQTPPDDCWAFWAILRAGKGRAHVGRARLCGLFICLACAPSPVRPLRPNVLLSHSPHHARPREGHLEGVSPLRRHILRHRSRLASLTRALSRLRQGRVSRRWRAGVADRLWRFPRAVLHVRPAQLVRHVSVVVRRTPAAQPPAVNDCLDWITTIMGLLFLGMCSHTDLGRSSLIPSFISCLGRLRGPDI